VDFTNADILTNEGNSLKCVDNYPECVWENMPQF